MSHAWRAWAMFGVGTLFGVVAGGVLYAPPELANQPAPWELWARGHGQAVAAAPVAAPVPAAVAAPAVAEPVVVAPAPVAVEPVAAASAPEVVAVRTPPIKRKPKIEEPAVDTSALGAGPAPQEPIRIQPEPLPAPVEAALPRSEADGSDPSR